MDEKKLIEALKELGEEEFRKSLGFSKDEWDMLKQTLEYRKWLEKLKARDMVQDRLILEALFNE